MARRRDFLESLLVVWQTQDKTRLHRIGQDEAVLPRRKMVSVVSTSAPNPIAAVEIMTIAKEEVRLL